MFNQNQKSLSKGKMFLIIEEDSFVIKNADLRVYPTYYFSGKIFIEKIIKKPHCFKAICRAEMDEIVMHIIVRVLNTCISFQFYYSPIDEIYIFENILPLFVVNRPLEDAEIIVGGRRQPDKLYEYKYSAKSFCLKFSDNKIAFYLSNLINGIKDLDYNIYKVKIIPVETTIYGLNSEKSIIEFTTHNIDKLNNALFKIDISIDNNILDISPLNNYVRINDNKIYRIIGNNDRWFLKKVHKNDLIKFIREVAFNYVFTNGSSYLSECMEDIFYSLENKYSIDKFSSLEDFFAYIDLEMLVRREPKYMEKNMFYRKILIELIESSKCSRIDSIYAEKLVKYLEGSEFVYKLGNTSDYLSSFDIFSLLRIVKTTGSIDSSIAERIFYEYLQNDTVKAEAAGLEESILLHGYPLLLFSEEALPVFIGVKGDKLWFKIWAARGSPRLYLKSTIPLNIKIESDEKCLDLQGKDLSVILSMNENDFKDILLTVARGDQ